MQYKFRKLEMNKNGEKIEFNFSLTVPKDIVTMIGSETKFTVEREGNNILFVSGADITPTNEQVEEYQFEDSRIE